MGATPEILECAEKIIIVSVASTSCQKRLRIYTGSQHSFAQFGGAP